MVLIFWPWASPRILISYYVVFQTKMIFFAWFRHFFKYFDKFWLFGHIWSFLNVFGCFWTTLDIFGHFRTYLTSFEVFWCARLRSKLKQFGLFWWNLLSYANNEVSIFNIFLSEKNFRGMFYSQIFFSKCLKSALFGWAHSLRVLPFKK